MGLSKGECEGVEWMMDALWTYNYKINTVMPQ